MLKKIVLPCLLLLVAQTMFAQTMMSEDDVVKFILVERAAQTSEQNITSKLLRKGVSKSRIQSAKEEIEKLDGAHGFSEGLVNDENEVPTRMRDESIMLKGVAQGDVVVDDSLVKSKVFGRDIFNNKMLTFAPALNIPTPKNYILGPGDQVLIDVWGVSQETIDDYISPDGFLIVSGVGPLKLAGKSVEEANEFVKSRLCEIYNNSEVSLSVGTMRSISIQVVGDVVVPGTYTLSALSTAFNALYAAGGVSDIGSLRSIKVYRNSKEIATIDVYAYLFSGNTKGNIVLQDNDVISVGTYNSLVDVQGKVKRPMIYEMKTGETFSKLLDYAGGFANNAYSEKIRVVRKSGREYSVHTLNKGDFSSFELKDGDQIQIDSIMPRFSNMVEISGAVFFPGQYELGKEVKTFKELVQAAGGFLERAFLERAVLHHRNFDGTREAMPIDVKGIIEGTSPDVYLKNNDLVFIPNLAQMRGEEFVLVGGEVYFPGKYKFAENLTLEDAILQAGGFKKSASVINIDVIRRKYDPAADKASDEVSEVYTLSMKDGFVVGQGCGFVLKPNDEVYVRKSPVYNDKQTVKITGSVNFGGNYAIRNNNYRLSDLVRDAKGFTGASYPAGTRLYRRLSPEDIKKTRFVLEKEKMRIMEQGISGDNKVPVALLDSLLEMKLENQALYLVAIDIEEAIKNPGSDADVLLKEGDELFVPEYVGTVKVTGEVFHPVTMSYKDGKNKSYYIKHAGGYANNAKKRGAYVVYMNGSVKKLTGKSSDIQPGCEIVVPMKDANRFGLDKIMGVATTTLSTAALVTSIVNSLK